MGLSRVFELLATPSPASVGARLSVVEGPMTLERFLALPASRRPMFVVSDGMGVDSLAMLIGLWRLRLRPDAILHADTGDEHPETVAYRDERRRWLRSVGFPDLTIVRRAPSVSKVTGLPFSTLGEKCVAYHTLPSLAFAGGKACSDGMENRTAGRAPRARPDGAAHVGAGDARREGDRLRRRTARLAARA